MLHLQEARRIRSLRRPHRIGLAVAGWMFQAAYEQHIKVLQIGDDTGQRLQMRGLNHDQEGAEHGQR